MSLLQIPGEDELLLSVFSTIFELLSKDDPLSEKELKEVKKNAIDLTDKMQGVLVLDWRKKQRRVCCFMEETLDQMPEVYDDNLWPRACDDVFLRVYDKYSRQGVSLYH